MGENENIINEYDIDLLYKPIDDFFKKFFQTGFSKEFTALLKEKNPAKLLGSISTWKLKTYECQIAHKDNPVTIDIVVGDLKTGIGYIPKKKRIIISVDADFFKAIKSKLLFMEEHKKFLKSFDLEEFLYFLAGESWYIEKHARIFFDGSYYKRIIQREIEHWIEDTIERRYTFKILEEANEIREIDNYLLDKKERGEEAYFYIGMDRQIEEIKHLKVKLAKYWDIFTIFDLISKSNCLSGIYINLDQRDIKKWLIALISRAEYEKMAGRNMFHFPYTDEVIRGRESTSHLEGWINKFASSYLTNL